MKFLKDENGIMNVWITVIIACLGFSLFYALTYDIVCVRLFNVMISIASSETPAGFYTNIDRFRLLYNILPFVFIFNIILYAFVHAQKKEYAPY
jgi:hypothetical protein